MGKIRLYNALGRTKQVFEPHDTGRVTFYVCGPTVYGASHIGNARPAVVFDMLARLLRHFYDEVVYVANITDIDDKITARAQEEGVDIGTISTRYHTQYREDIGALGVLPPDIEPLATAHIKEMQAMITKLLASGHAYEAEGHVLFDITRDTDYGTLSHRNREEMLAGARVEVAPFKRNEGDFVLWKPSTSEQPGWDSKWGRGRPGWHIECSAMIERHLGDTIDIHAGGIDLQFPHHENEAAQSRCVHGAPLARFWLHNGMLNIEGEKMSKSLGNITPIRDLLQHHSGEVIRLALLQTHYRQTLNFSDDLLVQSKTMLDRFRRETESITPASTPPEEFIAALADDLNTPQAMAVLFDLLKAGKKAELLAAARFIGLLAPRNTPDAATITQIEALITARNKARAARDFARADEVRAELATLGVDIEDTADGTKWRYNK